MSENSAVLALPYIQPSQAQKHVTHNEALKVLDALVQMVVSARDQSDPPAAPQTGDRFLLPAGATGAWAGQPAGTLACYDGVAWMFMAPQPGWRAHVLAEARAVTYDAAEGWCDSSAETLELAGLGVSASPDAVNRLAISSPATLFNHAGAGHQLKLNKAATAETASLLYQTDWSGRAEMGLNGGDDFSVKVSADGTAWTEALRIAAASGQVTGAAVQAGGHDSTAGRLLTAGAFGWGETGDLHDLTDLDALDTAAGLYRYRLGDTANIASRPAGISNYGLIRVERYDSGRCRQTITDALSPSRSFYRMSHPSTGWEGWREHYTSASILGGVSQSGGVPTGAVIERASNANGAYVRFADGTQICMSGQMLADVTVAAGAIFRSPPVTWAFPAAFSAAPALMQGRQNHSTAYWTVPGVTTTTSGEACAMSFQSITSRAVSLVALGRWF
ncbi:Protein of unknown function [Salinihabitans flavidus]|uniref:DUF2793 domain-containing protein n=1 Tax=Salinihabitans flavidus TaxID=569882 RepID=A0A1H8V242_9RHOB|nr:DUF2793 domain-containing protein [Salinihabitans flavidus]SEP09303.1 Protein of unknown function [Salinihabitans flavidus]